MLPMVQHYRILTLTAEANFTLNRTTSDVCLTMKLVPISKHYERYTIEANYQCYPQKLTTYFNIDY